MSSTKGVHEVKTSSTNVTHLHGLDPRVVFCGELFQDEVGVLVDANEVARLQLFRLDQTDHGQEVRLSRRGLDNRAFACNGIQSLF